MNKDLRIFTNEYSNNMTFPLLVGAAFATYDEYFLKVLENNKNLSINIPEMIKGIANPKE